VSNGDGQTDANKPGIRAALHAALALSGASYGRVALFAPTWSPGSRPEATWAATSTRVRKPSLARMCSVHRRVRRSSALRGNGESPRETEGPTPLVPQIVPVRGLPVVAVILAGLVAAIAANQL
jgi:hypothetical protein